MSFLTWAAFVLGSVFGSPLACLWDYDTLQIERSVVPSAHEAIVGYFPRHSEHYYRWRINDRSAIAINERSPADYDDIAVAHEKLSAHDDAIRTIEEKIKRWPEQGRYQSAANLATFLIHAGRFSEGLQHIGEALSINPDAHFGREKYQKRLVEYMLDREAAEKTKPSSVKEQGFDEYLWNNAQDRDSEEVIAEHEAAIQGVMGMIRFGNHDSPILLAALGDLLHSSNSFTDLQVAPNADRLAARAYLVASYGSQEPDRHRYREKAIAALAMQHDETIEGVEADLKQELEQATRLQTQIANDEKQWAANGENLDVAFASKYATVSPLEFATSNPWTPRIQAVMVIALVVIPLSIVYLLMKRWWHRRSKPVTVDGI